MVMAVANAIENGGTKIICASTGNTSASAAAYGAYCGLETYVAVPKGNVARGKLAQAIAYGARIILVDGNFDDALRIVRTLTERHPIMLVNSVNPYRLQGQKTAAFEIVEDLGTAPDFLFIPVGNAGNITAYWMGFKEAYDIERTSVRPRMMGFQAEGAAPIVKGMPIEKPQTIATAIKIGNPASWKFATAARDESGGTIDSVTDDEIMDAYKLLAQGEGIFCEPASAASVAGLMKIARNGADLSDQKIVCVITGNGLKDPDLAGTLDPVFMDEFAPEVGEIEKALGLS
jgi:threonine synthase